MSTQNLAISVAERTAGMLEEREARVLSWALLARLLFLSIIAVLTTLQTLELIPPGVISEGPHDAAPMLAITLATVAAVLTLYRLARAQKHIKWVGLGAVIVDIAVMSALPFIWLKTLPDLASFPQAMVKGDLFAIALLMIIINTITLTPLYPALMTAGSLCILGSVAFFALNRPDLEVTDSYLVHSSTMAVNLGILYLRVVIMVLSGAFLSLLAYTARRTIRQTVELEISNLELRERQAEMVLAGRMAALDGMVAGIAHEINSPLGAVRSGIDTAEACIKRLAPAAQAVDPTADRTARLAGDVMISSRQGLDRIKGLVDSLRGFARLDEAEVQEAELHRELDTVLSLIEPTIIGNISIEKNYGAIPIIRCRPRELNQAFMTILVNAFEAMNGEGRLAIRTETSGSNVRVTISDTGPGIPPDLAPHLFELRLNPKGRRVGMGLGLPTSRRIVERHGGQLRFDARPGQGTTFTITLPVKSVSKL